MVIATWQCKLVYCRSIPHPVCRDTHLLPLKIKNIGQKVCLSHHRRSFGGGEFLILNEQKSKLIPQHPHRMFLISSYCYPLSSQFSRLSVFKGLSPPFYTYRSNPSYCLTFHNPSSTRWFVSQILWYCVNTMAL
jgi:hypothetical protein